MHTELGAGAALRFPAGLTRALVIGWVLGLTLIYLVLYEAWLYPVQFAHLAASAVGTLSIGPHFGEFVLARLGDIGAVLAIFATAFAVGATVVGRLIPDRNLFGGLFALTMGLWIVAVAVLAIGVVSVRGIGWVHLGLCCWALPEPRRYFRRRERAVRWDTWSVLMLTCVAGAALLTLLGAMAPPFEYDELEYHLGAPAEYLRTGHITFLPHNVYSNFPQLTSMLYLLAMTVSSEIAAKLVHWTFGVLTAVSIYALVTRMSTSQRHRAGLTAAALFYCMPFVQDLGQTARADLATTFFATLAFGGLLMWSQSVAALGERGSRLPDVEAGPRLTSAATTNHLLWLSALICGAAVATKWTAVPVVLLPAAIFVAVVRKSLRMTAVFCLLSSVFVLPWLVKNLVFTGNPVYPFLTGLFPNPHWSPAQAALFSERNFVSFGPGMLWQLVERAWQFSVAQPGSVPLLLMMVPLIVLLRGIEQSARRAAWLFLLTYACWFFLTQQPWRYLMPALPLAAIVGAYALDALFQDKVLRVGACGALGLTLVAGLTCMGVNALVDVEQPDRLPPRVSFFQFALGGLSRDEFVAQMGRDGLEPVIWMNQRLPATACVLYIGEARPVYARQKILWSTAYDHHPLVEMMRRAVDTPQLLAEMRRRGITHIYVNFAELQRLGLSYGYLREINRSTFEQFLGDHTHELHKSRVGAVYELSV